MPVVDQLQLDYDYATMALRGNRYQEAQQRFDALVRKTNAATAWCGLGAAKLPQVLSGQASLDEAIYCFERAGSSEPAKRAEVEAFLLVNLAQLYQQVATVYQQTFGTEKKAKRDVIGGYALMAFSPIMGIGKDRSLYEQMTAAAGTAGGLYIAANAAKTKEQAIQLRDRARATMEAIRTSARSFVNQTGKPYLEFARIIDPLHQELIEKPRQLEAQRAAAQAAIAAQQAQVAANRRQARVRVCGQGQALLYDGFYRSSDEKMVFGVCGGLAHKFKIDVSILRVLGVCFAGFYVLAGLILKPLPTKGIP